MQDRIVARQLDLKSQSRTSLNTEKVIVDLETRLQRKAVDGADVGQKRKPKGGGGRNEFSDAQEVLSRHYYRRFAPEFNYFRHGRGIPGPELKHSRIFAFLRFHL